MGFLGTSILYWSSKTQRGIIALSSTESEFIQLALSVRQVLYVQPLFLDIGFGNIEQASIVYGDNLPAINSIGNDSAKSRTKHIDIRLKFCGEVLSANKLIIKYVPTAENIADIFTKPLPAPRFRELWDKIVFKLNSNFARENPRVLRSQFEHTR